MFSLVEYPLPSPQNLVGVINDFRQDVTQSCLFWPKVLPQTQKFSDDHDDNAKLHAVNTKKRNSENNAQPRVSIASGGLLPQPYTHGHTDTHRAIRQRKIERRNYVKIVQSKGGVQ